MIGSTGAKTGVLALILALLPTLLSAAVVRISWNANTESDLEGYRVFFGTSHGYYGNVINVGRRTTVDVSGLAAGTTYFFAVTAYDYSGNESAFSEERSVAIPASSAPEGSEPDSEGGVVDTVGDVVEWLEQVVRNLFGLDPDVPVYALGDFGLVDPEESPNPSGSVTFEQYTGQGASGYEELCALYPVRDVILERGFPFDLSSLYRDEAHLFYPLDGHCPEIDDYTVVPGYTGYFIYVVFGETGSVDHLLRLSVVEQIYVIRTCDPSAVEFIEDTSSGVAIELPVGATEAAGPIAIGWGGLDAFLADSVLTSPPCTYFFDILPYGLVLSEPALVSLPFEGSQATAEWYDNVDNTWVPIEDVLIEEGYLSFSAQALGRFRVTTIPEGGGAVSEDVPYEGRDTSCFMAVSSQGGIFPCLSVLLTGTLVYLAFVLRRFFP